MQTLNLRRQVNGDQRVDVVPVVEIDVPPQRVPSVTKITYTRRFNLGDYQHEEITVEAVVDERTGSPEQELLAIRQLVAENCTTRLRHRALAKQQSQSSQPS